MTTTIVNRVITFYSPDPEADCERLNQLCGLPRLGFGWVVTEPRPGGSQVVSVKVRAGSVAERYVMRREQRGRMLTVAQ